MGIEQKLRESFHRSARSVGESNLRWEDIGQRPILPRSRSLARATFAVFLALAISIGSFLFLHDAFTSHRTPMAHRSSLTAESLAAGLGLSRYEVRPAGCNAWVEVLDQGPGYCLDGVVSGGAERFLVSQELQGTIPAQSEIDRVSRMYGEQVPNESATIALANVQLRGVSDGVAHVGYDVEWPEGVFPGVYRCTWTVLDASGHQVGSVSDGLAAMAPQRLEEDVPTTGTPTQAEASCGERLNTGTPYSYDFTNVSGSPGLWSSFDATWAGTGTPGAVACIAIYLDETGAFVDLHNFNLFSGVREPVSVRPNVPSVSQPPVPMGSARIACSPLVESVPTGRTYVEGARPGPHADAATGQGCVPYSPDRPGVKICGPVPADFAPEPPPYFNKDLCDAAALWVNNPDAMSAASAKHFPRPPEGKGPVEVSTCRIVQYSNSPMLDVVFVRDGGKDNVHVQYYPDSLIP